MNNLSVLEKKKIGNAFNKSANTYDENCYIQLKVGNKLISLLSKYVKDYSNIIDLGCGTGLLTKKLATQLKYKHFIAIDIAALLIDKAAIHLKNYNIKTIVADFDNLNLKPFSQDITFSNMALQWSVDIKQTLKEINRLLTKNGILAFSIPIDGTFKELKKAIKSVNSHSSIKVENKNTNQFIYPNELINLIKGKGFEIIETEISEERLLFKDIYSLLKYIKKTGATYIKNRNNFTYKGNQYFNDLSLRYSKEKDGSFKLTYNILFCICKKII